MIKKLMMLLVATMAIIPMFGATIDENWWPEWREDRDGDGYYYYPASMTCSERDNDMCRLNNGCSVKIVKTNSKGYTKFTATYLDDRGRKQTVSHSWRDDGSGVYFEVKGRRYWFNWDATPYGCWLSVDVDANGEWTSETTEHFYVIEPNNRGGVVIPTEWQKARTINGLYGEACNAVDGTAQLKCGKANSKGIAKVSLTITPFNGRKRTYRSVSVDVSRGGNVKVSWPNQAYAVMIHENGEFFGEPIYKDGRPCCSPNAVWSADIGGAMAGEYFINFPKWSDSYYDWHNDEGYEAFMKVAAAKLWYQYGEGGYCPIASNILFGGGYFMVSGKKWNFSSQFGNERPPRINYNPKTGVFTGSVYLTTGLYCMDIEGKTPKSKKFTLKIKGVYSDGEIYGVVTYKTFSTPIAGGSTSW